MQSVSTELLIASTGPGLILDDLYCYDYNVSRKRIEMVLWRIRRGNSYVRFYASEKGLGPAYKVYILEKSET